MDVVVTDAQLSVPGGSVFARQWHPEQDAREPILLLHDSSGSVVLWRDLPNALALATGRMVVACDCLGFGRSTPRAAAPTCNFILEEAELYFPVLVQALDIPACLLYGHSVGGVCWWSHGTYHGSLAPQMLQGGHYRSGPGICRAPYPGRYPGGTSSLCRAATVRKAHQVSWEQSRLGFRCLDKNLACTGVCCLVS